MTLATLERASFLHAGRRAIVERNHAPGCEPYIVTTMGQPSDVGGTCSYYESATLAVVAAMNFVQPDDLAAPEASGETP